MTAARDCHSLEVMSQSLDQILELTTSTRSATAASLVDAPVPHTTPESPIRTPLSSAGSPPVAVAHARALELIGIARRSLLPASRIWDLIPEDYLTTATWVEDYGDLIVRMDRMESLEGDAGVAVIDLTDLLSGRLPDLDRDSWRLANNDQYQLLRQRVLKHAQTIDAYEADPSPSRRDCAA